MDLLAELWRRLSQSTPVPTLQEFAVAAAVAVVLLLLTWRIARLIVTLCHETGHATAAVFTGRRVKGMKIHGNGAGVTLSQGRPVGPGMVLTIFSGYPAASVFGLIAISLIVGERAFLLAGLATAASAVALLRMRNLLGAALVVAVGGGMGILAWFSTGRWMTWVMSVLAFVLLLGGLQAILISARGHRWRTAASDTLQLAALTRVPAYLWYTIWVVIAAGSLAGAGLLVLGTF